jgi:hypothetical protein
MDDRIFEIASGARGTNVRSATAFKELFPEQARYSARYEARVRTLQTIESKQPSTRASASRMPSPRTRAGSRPTDSRKNRWPPPATACESSLVPRSRYRCVLRTNKLHRNVRAICRQAGVSEVAPHGLRGTHADLALPAAAPPPKGGQPGAWPRIADDDLSAVRRSGDRPAAQASARDGLARSAFIRVSWRLSRPGRVTQAFPRAFTQHDRNQDRPPRSA